MTPEEQQARRKRFLSLSQSELFPECQEVRQFRVNRPWELWNDVTDDKVWGIVTRDTDTYVTRILYTHPV